MAATHSSLPIQSACPSVTELGFSLLPRLLGYLYTRMPIKMVVCDVLISCWHCSWRVVVAQCPCMLLQCLEYQSRSGSSMAAIMKRLDALLGDIRETFDEAGLETMKAWFLSAAGSVESTITQRLSEKALAIYSGANLNEVRNSRF